MALTIIYGVRLRKTKSRFVVELVRDGYQKQLCHFQGGQYGSLVFASKKPRHFLDAEDERRIRNKCRDEERLHEGIIAPVPPAEQRRIGSIEISLHLKKGPLIEVRYVSGELFGTWEPDTGLRLTKDAHPAIAGDKKHIAKICSELPQGSGGIFQKDPEEPTL